MDVFVNLKDLAIPSVERVCAVVFVVIHSELSYGLMRK